jgi:hypothetical protein
MFSGLRGAKKSGHTKKARPGLERMTFVWTGETFCVRGRAAQRIK